MGINLFHCEARGGAGGNNRFQTGHKVVGKVDLLLTYSSMQDYQTVTTSVASKI